MLCPKSRIPYFYYFEMCTYFYREWTFWEVNFSSLNRAFNKLHLLLQILRQSSQSFAGARPRRLREGLLGLHRVIVFSFTPYIYLQHHLTHTNYMCRRGHESTDRLTLEWSSSPSCVLRV